MDIRYPIHIFALLSLSQASSAQKKPAMDQKKPNVLFVMSDQHRRQALGFMKEDPVITPNLDINGMDKMSGFVAETVCFSALQ